MDQIGDELKKVLQAGIGAVAVGMEKTQEVIEKLSQKGEPIYEQAKKTVADTADKVKQAVADCGKNKMGELLNVLRSLSREDRELVRQALDELDAAEAREAAPADDRETAEEMLREKDEPEE